MQNSADVKRLNILLGEEKVEFQAAREALREALVPLQAPDDIDERLMAYADEFGIDSAVLMLKRSPMLFDVEGKVDREVIAVAVPTVEKLVVSNRVMAGLIVQRENILVAQNPEHNRVYINKGREFTIERRGGQVVQYTDTGEIQKLEVVKEDGTRAKQLRKAWDSEEQEQDQDQGQLQ